MKPSKSQAPVERLFPFVLRSRILLTGREALLRQKGQLHFVLITTDLSENSRKEILREYAHYPIVQRYTPAELEAFFKVRGAKVVGFKKSDLAKSIYAELKEHRVNVPAKAPEPAVRTEPGASPESKATPNESTQDLG